MNPTLTDEPAATPLQAAVDAVEVAVEQLIKTPSTSTPITQTRTSHPIHPTDQDHQQQDQQPIKITPTAAGATLRRPPARPGVDQAERHRSGWSLEDAEWMAGWVQDDHQPRII